MARQRVVKPEFWHDERMAQRHSRDARLLYVAMWNLADEHARIRLSPHYIKGQVFAYDDDLTPAVVSGLVEELVASGRVEPYTVGGERYGLVRKLADHQRLEPDKSASRLPDPSAADPAPRADDAAQIPDNPAPDADESALSYSSTVLLSSSVTDMSPADEPPGRADVDGLCTLLAEKITKNGVRPPKVTKDWRDAARLLLDRDHRPLEEARRLIVWSQQNSFWRSNVLSMPKFREKYDQLLLQSSRAGPPGRVQPFRNPADQSDYQEAL